MKQGSTDDPFAEDADDEPEDSRDEAGNHFEQSPDSDRSLPTDTPASSSTQTRSLPYIHSRDGVKDGRKQRPVFLRDHVESGIDELVSKMETEFGEDVYKTDVTEAAMAVAQENPALVQEKLDEWGYGWE